MSSRQAYPADQHGKHRCQGCGSGRNVKLAWWRGERDDKRERERRAAIRLQDGCIEVEATALLWLCWVCRRLARAA